MSSTNKGRKIRSRSGMNFLDGPDGAESGSVSFAMAIAGALKREFGGTHAAVKTVVALTNANERAVKNWFNAKNGPSGQYLVDLIRSSDAVLETLLTMAGRDEILTAKKLADARGVLTKMLSLLDELPVDAGTD